MKLPSPKELDAQSEVRISKWVDIYSTECAVLDPDVDMARKFLKILTKEPAALHTDTQGRLWGTATQEGKYYPYHFEANNGKLIGYKISAKAAN